MESGVEEKGAPARVFNFPGNGSIFFAHLDRSIHPSIQVGIQQFGHGADELTLPGRTPIERDGSLLATQED